jgi:hypothetical protein
VVLKKIKNISINACRYKIVVYLCNVNKAKQLKISTMKTFNKTITIEEANAIINFKGETMYPDTDHNRKMIALALDNFLKKLHGK